MIVVEAITCAKDPLAQDGCEDRLVALPDRCIAVVDGATDLSGRRFDGRTGGWLAAEAVAAALAGLDGMPDRAAVGDAAHSAIADLYHCLGPRAPHDPRDRFRAAFAVVYILGNAARLVVSGDCTAQVDGEARLARPAGGEALLAAMRTELWRALAEKGVPQPVIATAVRAAIADGLDTTPQAPLEPNDVAHARATVLDHATLVEAAGGAQAAARLLSVGLRGMRSDPATFGLGGVDGVAPPNDLRSLDLDARATVELASDGYPVPGLAPTVASWEAAFASVEAEDPHRIARFAATKGSSDGCFADDRTLVIRRVV